MYHFQVRDHKHDMSIGSHIHGFCLHLGKFLPMKEKTVIFLIRLSFCLVAWRRERLYFYWWFIYVRLFLNGSCLRLFSVLSVKLSLRRDGSVDRMSGSQSKYPSTSILSSGSENLWQSFLFICYNFFFFIVLHHTSMFPFILLAFICMQHQYLIFWNIPCNYIILFFFSKTI